MRWLIICGICCTFLFASAQEINVVRISSTEGIRVDDIRSILHDSRGILWVGTYGDGVLVLKDGRFVHPAGANQYTGPYVFNICEGEFGEILVRSRRGIAVYDGRKWEEYHGSAGPCQEAATDGVIDSVEADLGTTFYARETGLYSKGLLDEDAVRIVDKSGLLDDTIQALAFDRGDALWIGTRNHGLLRRFVERRIQCRNETFVVSDMAVDHSSGQLWAHAGEGRLTVRKAGADSITTIFTDSPVREFVPFGEGRIIANDREGKLMLIYGDTAISSIELAHGLQAVRMKADLFGVAWIVDNAGRVYVAEEIEGGIRVTETFAVIPVEELLDIYPTGNGDMLVLYTSSLGELTNGRFRVLETMDSKLTCADMDRSGVLWLGSADGRIFRFISGGKIVEITGSEIDLSRPLRFLHRLPNGLIVADDVSIYQISLDPTGSVIEDVYTMGDLPAGGVERFAYHNGELLFSSGRQICRIPVEGSALPGFGPTVFLRDILLPSGSVAETAYSSNIYAFMRQSGKVVFPYRENDLVFSWEAISSVPGEITYAYRLRRDEQWQPVEGSNQIQLVSLAPGTYAFDVRACDSRIQCSTLDGPWEFEIRKPWWQLWWIWILVAGGMISLLIFVVGRREERIRMEAQRKVELADARARAIELEQMARQLQMRPHFISNALNAIQSSLINGEPEQASEELVRFSRMMRAMLNSSRKDRVSLEDELTLLNEYVAVVGMAKGYTTLFEVKMDKDIDPDDIEIPPMLLQPVIENAIEHGGPKIVVEISITGDLLGVDVWDNGPGFSRESKNKEGSVAIKLLEERLKAVGGSAEFTNATGGGALVRLVIPV